MIKVTKHIGNDTSIVLEANSWEEFRDLVEGAAESAEHLGLWRDFQLLRPDLVKVSGR